MKNSFLEKSKALIGVVHLKPLPGAPRWDGNFKGVD
jgi:predicted TIM-barrel enzyme